jgi:3-phenylpropionate/cinnamic acid dioxygenase small subunit
MNLEELLAREGIRKTLVGYTMAGDRLKTDDFVAVFTDDAVIETEGVVEADHFRYQGRDAIRAWMNRWRESAGKATGRTARFIRHHLSTCQIELTAADTAQARTYWVAYTDIGPDHCGHYLDEFRKVGDDWLIAHRRIRLDWQRADSLYLDAVARTRG